MSDVEKWIERWRAHLAGSELLGGPDVKELESHLREEMEHLKTTGLCDDEAFLVARRRLGNIASLEAEFAKVNTHRLLTNRLWWMTAGVLAYLVAAHFAGVASQVSLAITELTDLSPRALGLVATAVRLGAFCAVAGLVLWLCVRYSQPGVHSHIRISRRLRLVFLLGLFAETLGLYITRVCGTTYLVRRTGLQNVAQIQMVESIGYVAWTLMGPVLLGVLLMLIHLAGRRKIELQ